jgi:Protein of unknown function (DUF1524)
MKILIYLILIFNLNSSFAKYVRKEWKHWSDRDKNCLNTKEEILKARSKSIVLTSKKGCRIKSGSWDDYYYPETINDMKQIDVDHLIPLKHAYDTGGANWSPEKKEQFANDPENLVITDKKYNRQKGAKGIDQWLPINKEYACKYVKDWIKVKMKYGLRMDEPEKLTISAIQGSCVK